MASKRYTVVIASRTTGTLHRVTFSLRPTLVVLGILIALPILIGLGARWSVRAELSALRSNAATLEQDNASYRAAQSQLTTQILSLQGAIREIGEQAKVDPTSGVALAKLERMLASQGTGGGSTGRDPQRTLLAPSLASPEDSFGMLRNLLGQLESRLQIVRSDVEDRATRAAATPSIWPAFGSLSASFGQRSNPFGGDGIEFHPGLDISTAKGSPVFATASGTVVSTGWNGNYGNMIVLNHGYGVQTRYAHLSGFAVRPGARVSRNQTIGYVGATGRATGPHLHYELVINGTLTNPLTLLTRPAR